jgi:hypothetical protein
MEISISPKKLSLTVEAKQFSQWHWLEYGLSDWRSVPGRATMSRLAMLHEGHHTPHSSAKSKYLFSYTFTAPFTFMI